MSELQPPSRALNGAVIPPPARYAFDPVHTFAEFTAQHLVVGRVRGRFDRTAGTLTIDADPADSSLEFRIETASVSTHDPRRDADLRGPRFFHADAFPLMTYRSLSFVPELNGRWTVAGELIIREVTRPVPLSAWITGVHTDDAGSTRIGIQAEARISRRDFGLLTDLERENGGVPLGADVVISIVTEAVRQP